MEPRDEAPSGVQRAHAVDAALDAHVEAQLELLRRVLAQARKGQIVAGADRQELLALVPGFGNDALQVGAQRFDVRLEALARPQLCPEQALAEIRQPGRLPLCPHDQRFIELLLPRPQDAPDVSVGAPQRRRRAPDRPPIANRLQHRKQRLVQVATPLGARGEGVAEADAGRRCRGGGRRLGSWVHAVIFNGSSREDNLELQAIHHLGGGDFVRAAGCCAPSHWRTRCDCGCPRIGWFGSCNAVF